MRLASFVMARQGYRVLAADVGQVLASRYTSS